MFPEAPPETPVPLLKAISMVEYFAGWPAGVVECRINIKSPLPADHTVPVVEKSHCLASI
jgi:hypothetical protein